MKNKSCEINPIPTNLLQKCIDHLLPVLTRLVSISLQSGVFSQKWKVAIVKPLLKKSGMELVSSSYRPISNLKFVSKLVESCAMDRLNEHCDYNRLIPDYQSAYRRFYSCETSVLKLVNDILWGMESQEISSMIACNLSTAFDTVDHSLLLDVLSNKFRVGGTAPNWFDSYLHPRSLQVMIRKELSSERNLPFSVPQGSCTGAQLFNLYCSTLHEVVISSEDNEKPLLLYGFADDHTVHDQFKANDRSAESESITKLQQCASSLKSWMDLNKLRINNAKTEFILYDSQPQLDKCTMDEILIVDSIIKRSETVYCNSILAGLPNSEKSLMQRVQNIAAKLVLGKSKFHSSLECLRELHWLPINKWIQFKVLILVFKCLDCTGPLYLRNLLVDFPEDRKQGLHGDNIVKRLLEPRTKLKTFASRAFSVIGLKWWNQLPNHVKNCGNLTNFKKSLKTYLFINDLN